MKICKYCNSKTVEKQNDYYVCTKCGKVNKSVSDLRNEIEYENIIPTTSIYTTSRQYLSSDLNKKQTYIKDYPEIKKVSLLYTFYKIILHTLN